MTDLACSEQKINLVKHSGDEREKWIIDVTEFSQPPFCGKVIWRQMTCGFERRITLSSSGVDNGIKLTGKGG